MAISRRLYVRQHSNSDYPKSSLTYFGISEIKRTQRETSWNRCRPFEVAAPTSGEFRPATSNGKRLQNQNVCQRS
jgi:hypothetical protein